MAGIEQSISKPVNSDAAASNSETNSDNLEGALYWIVKSGPRWIRIPGIFMAAAVALSSPIVAIHNGLVTLEATIAPKDPVANQLTMTSGAKTWGDFAAIEAVLGQPNANSEDKAKAEKALQTTKHRMEHLSAANDDVHWVVFGKKTPDDYFAYKIFPSDKCLLISRVEHGQGTAEWLTDQNLPTSQSAPSSAALPSAPSPRSLNAVFLQSDPSRHASLLQTGSDGEPRIDLSEAFPDEKYAVQNGCIANHPGTPSVTTGPQIDSCHTPTLRRWSDGCLQVQVFDKCKNIWGPVVWQACSAVHHP